jgi:hypothetical protein
VEERLNGTEGHPPLIVVHVDLNPTPRLLTLYHLELKRLKLHDVICRGTPTHCRGQQLERGFTNDPTRVKAVVHNGDNCQSDGCVRQQCGNHRAVFNSDDLDHYATVFTAWPPDVEQPKRQRELPAITTATNAWKAVYVKDADRWEESIAAHVDAFSASVATEMELWCTHAGTWQLAPEPVIRQAASLTSWLVRASTVYAAMRGHILNLVPPRARAVARLVPVGNFDIEVARATRGAATRSFTKAAAGQAEQYCQLLVDSTAKAESFMSALLRSKGAGLPEELEDPFCPGVVVTGADVIIRASQYIGARGQKRHLLPTTDSAWAQRAKRRRTEIAMAFRA